MFLGSRGLLPCVLEVGCEVLVARRLPVSRERFVDTPLSGPEEEEPLPRVPVLGRVTGWGVRVRVALVSAPPRRTPPTLKSDPRPVGPASPAPAHRQACGPAGRSVGRAETRRPGAPRLVGLRSPQRDAGPSPTKPPQAGPSTFLRASGAGAGGPRSPAGSGYLWSNYESARSLSSRWLCKSST